MSLETESRPVAARGWGQREMGGGGGLQIFQGDKNVLKWMVLTVVQLGENNKNNYAH